MNYFAAVSRTTNPGAGVTYPYVAIDQRDEEYWKRVNAAYVAKLKKEEVAEREKQMKGIWEAKAKKELEAAEAALPDLKKAEAEGKEKKLPDLKERTEAVKKAEERIKALKDDLKNGKFPALTKRWESSEIYASDAFKLLTNKDLCLKCHNIGNIQIEGVQGPNLTLAAERLRPDWSEEWIAHPKRMFTYAPVMPQNFPNEPDPLKWKYQDSFVGSPHQQIRAVRDILMDQSRLSDLLATPTPSRTPGGRRRKKVMLTRFCRAGQACAALALTALLSAAGCDCCSCQRPDATQPTEQESQGAAPEGVTTSTPAVGATTFTSANLARAEEWGTVTGQVVFGGGAAPANPPANVDKDKGHCLSKGPILKNDLVVNPKNKGVRYVLVWLTGVDDPKSLKPIPIKPSLAKMEKSVTIDQPCCSFEPRVLGMREGQTLIIKNSSPIAHNSAINGGVLGPSVNPIIPSKGEFEVKNIKARPLPLLYTCSIHAWMKGGSACFATPTSP